jgi:hypothetical protein
MVRLLIIFAFIIQLIGCGGSKKQTETDPIPEVKPAKNAITKTSPKEEPKVLPVSEPKIDSNVIEFKRGEAYRYGDLLISIEEVTHLRPWYGRYLGTEGYFEASRVSIKLQNTSSVKIADWSGWYFKGGLQDEHGNVFKHMQILGWIFPVNPPDLSERINPGKAIYTSLFFDEIPQTSKKFIFKAPLNGKILVWKGILEEKAKIDAANDKKEFEDMKEKDRIEIIAKEAARKKNLEGRGLAFYPLPVINKVADKDINEWYNLLSNSQSPDSFNSSLEAIKSYGDAGIPFLLEALKNNTNSKSRELILWAMYPNNIHPNDLPKIVECLNKSKDQIGTRVQALNLLVKSGNAKQYQEKIESMTKDLLINKNVKDQVKGYLDKLK